MCDKLKITQIEISKASKSMDQDKDKMKPKDLMSSLLGGMSAMGMSMSMSASGSDSQELGCCWNESGDQCIANIPQNQCPTTWKAGSCDCSSNGTLN